MMSKPKLPMSFLTETVHSAVAFSDLLFVTEKYA